MCVCVCVCERERESERKRERERERLSDSGEGDEGGVRTQKTKEKICFCLFSEIRKKSEVTKRGVQEKEKPERH